MTPRRIEESCWQAIELFEQRSYSTPSTTSRNTAERGRKELSDQEQLDFARRTGRVISTTDRHFLPLVAEWLRDGVEFPGVVYHAQGALTKGQAIRALLLLNEVFVPSDMVNRLEFSDPSENGFRPPVGWPALQDPIVSGDDLRMGATVSGAAGAWWRRPECLRGS